MGLRNAIEFYKREEVITENATYEIAEGEQGKQIAQREKRKMKRSREKAKGKN